MSAKLTTQDFIDRARAVHGDKYGYAFSVYQSTSKKVYIHCPEHGMFKQTPNHHVNGRGCPGCFGTEKYTNDSFIKKAREIHGDFYDYSCVEYVNSQTKIKIVCNYHGVFEQNPNNHLRGRGCPSCSCVKKHTNESFIEKAKLVHDDRYDYSHVKYVNSETKVEIHCIKHGLFEQRPSHHLNGSGCPFCADELQKCTKKEFIEKANSVHFDTYDYSKVVYHHSQMKIKIICPTHGIFEQIPNHHLQGTGCPGCAKSGFDRTRSASLYILRSSCGCYMKIGITHNPKQRHSKLSRATPFLFNVIELIEGPGDQIANLEKELLAEYTQTEFTETFDGSTEWRLWDDSIRNKVKKDLRP